MRAYRATRPSQIAPEPQQTIATNVSRKNKAEPAAEEAVDEDEDWEIEREIREG
jgi:hypothetical protein